MEAICLDINPEDSKEANYYTVIDRAIETMV
jgi:hypothetical protein